MNTAFQTIHIDDQPVRSRSADSDGGYTVDVIRTDAEFDLLERTWNDLIDGADVTVFQTFEWQRTWWKYFHRDLGLHILLFRSGEDTVAIAPLCMRRVRLFGIPVARHLHFIGAGLSDYLSPIIRAGHERPVLEAFAGYLADTTREWDVFDLTDVNESMACARILPSVFGEKHLPVYRYQGTVCPGILLTSSFENLVQLPGLSKNYNLKRKFRKLRLHFQSEINLVRSETDDIDRAVEDFALIHGGRWKSQGYPSAFDDPHNKAFHVEVCRKFAARDWLRMYFLKVDGRRIASCFNFNYRKKIYMYQSNAHGPDNVMKCSPGFLIRSVAIDEGIREGMRVFDFLRGNETYKYSEWNATDSKNWLIRTSSTSGCGKISFFLFLISEFITKAGDRLFREYREYRRFRISGKGRFNSIRYLWRRCSYLAGTVIHFFSRHTHLSGKESGRGESGDF